MNMETESKKPLVSVIMPTYNHAQFIRESIDSVLQQTYGNFELIIVDNYSDDSTEEIVSSYVRRDRRIRYIKFFNKGVIATSRNLGIDMAKGEYIAFLDSDDLWMKDKLSIQLSVFRRHEDVGLVYAEAKLFDDRGFIRPRIPKKKYSGFVFEKLLSTNFIHCLTVMVRRDVLEKTGPFDVNSDLVAAEDYELWLRVSYHYKVMFINKVLAMQRIHLRNISPQKADLSWRALRVVFEKVDVSEEQKRCAISHCYADMGRTYLKLQQYEQFKKYTMQSLNMHFNWKAAIAICFWFIFREKGIHFLIKSLGSRYPRRA